jgi:hypothetical protein
VDYIKELIANLWNTVKPNPISKSLDSEIGTVSQEFLCLCGMNKTWISEGCKTERCPSCDRIYIGRYNDKAHTIDAEEIK